MPEKTLHKYRHCIMNLGKFPSRVAWRCIFTKGMWEQQGHWWETLVTCNSRNVLQAAQMPNYQATVTMWGQNLKLKFTLKPAFSKLTVVFLMWISMAAAKEHTYCRCSPTKKKLIQCFCWTKPEENDVILLFNPPHIRSDKKGLLK